MKEKTNLKVGRVDLKDEGSRVRRRACVLSGIMSPVSQARVSIEWHNHAIKISNSTGKARKTHMRMCRPGFQVWKDPLLFTTPLLFPLIIIRPKLESARRVETGVCHQQETDAIRLSFSDSGQMESSQPGCCERNKTKNGYPVIKCRRQDREPSKWFRKIVIDPTDAAGFQNMSRDDVGNFVA